MNSVAELAATAGARLAPKVGLLKVDILKTFADNSLWGILVEPHQYELRIAQCDRKFHQTSMTVKHSQDVSFWLGVLNDRAKTNNLAFEAHDHTKEFAQELRTLK